MPLSVTSYVSRSDRTPVPGVNEVWWINPAKLVVGFIIPLYVLVFLLPTVLGASAVMLRFRNYLNWPYFLLGLAFLVVLFNSALIGTQIVSRSDSQGTAAAPIQLRYLEVLALLTIGAYVVWFHGLILRPWLVLDYLRAAGSGVAHARMEHQTIPGITTATQFGIAYVVLFLDRVWGAGVRPVARRYTAYLLLIFGFAGFRALAWGERLALIELVIPGVVMYFVLRPPSGGWINRLLRWFGPFVGIAALLVYFGATEFFRSWAAYYQYQRVGFVEFIGRRLITYYYTALNNGAGLLQLSEWPTYTFGTVLSWLYKFPGIGAVLRYVFDIPPGGSFLFKYGDPEFNNMSGIFPIFADLGIAGGLAFAALWGGVVGYFYNQIKRRQGIGRVLFPMVYVSLLEVMRVPYLSDSRAFPALVAMGFGYLLFRETSAHRATLPIRALGRVP
jgi:hypothetical protein